MDSCGHNCGCFTRNPKQETIEEASWKYNPVKKLDNEFIRAAFIAGPIIKQQECIAKMKFIIY